MKKYYFLLMILAMSILSLISREPSSFLYFVNKLDKNSAMRQICNENARSLSPDLEKQVHCHYLGTMLYFFKRGLDEFDTIEDKEKFMFPNEKMDSFLLGSVMQGLGIVNQLEQVNDPEVQKEIEFFVKRKLEILEKSIKKQTHLKKKTD